MRYDQAKERILIEWDRWIEKEWIDRGVKPTARETLKFFIELQDARSPLLDFRSRGRDKWQILHQWLEESGRVLEFPQGPAPPLRPKDRLFRGRC